MEKKQKIREGVVVSDKMDKTVVVTLNALKSHPKYQKKYIFTKRYKVHDPDNKCKIGDKVRFIECRPISKEKRYKIV